MTSPSWYRISKQSEIAKTSFNNTDLNCLHSMCYYMILRNTHMLLAVTYYQYMMDQKQNSLHHT